jgi:hypothetical protein
MPFNLSTFKGELLFDGARPTLFEVQLNFPQSLGANAAGQKSIFMVNAAQLPASSVGNIEVGYFGRKIKVPGDRTFEDWTVTVINDENFTIRNAMEAWLNALNSHAGNVRNANFLRATNYTADMLVNQYGKDGAVIKTVKLIDAFPTSLTAIDLNWDTNNSIETFSVTFSYQWWEAANTTDAA